jgi:hypothetical protein
VLNTSEVLNKSTNTLSYGYSDDYLNLTWAIQCHDTYYQSNFTIGNRSLNLNLYKNVTAATFTFPGTTAGETVLYYATITDLNTSKTISSGTATLNYTIPGGMSYLQNVVWNPFTSRWEGTLTLTVQGVWGFNFSYNGGNLFSNSSASMVKTILPAPEAPGGGGGGGGYIPPVTNVTNVTKTIDLGLTQLIPSGPLDAFLKSKYSGIPMFLVVSASTFGLSAVFRRWSVISFIFIAAGLYIVLAYSSIL